MHSIINPSPIFSLNILRTTFHIVKSPELIVAVERNSKTLSFLPLIAKVFPRLLGIGPQAMKLIGVNINREEGSWGLMYESLHTISSGLKSGPNLEGMKRTMLATFLLFVNKLDEEQSNDGMVISLWSWVSEKAIIANTEALYGTGNPFRKDIGLPNCFW